MVLVAGVGEAAAQVLDAGEGGGEDEAGPEVAVFTLGGVVLRFHLSLEAAYYKSLKADAKGGASGIGGMDCFASQSQDGMAGR